MSDERPEMTARNRLLAAMSENEKQYRLLLGGVLAPLALLASQLEALEGLSFFQRCVATVAVVSLLAAAVFAGSAVGHTHTARRNIVYADTDVVAKEEFVKLETVAEARSDLATLFGTVGYALISMLFILKIWQS